MNTLIVAVSGGIDSVVLLDILANGRWQMEDGKGRSPKANSHMPIADIAKRNIIVAHVDHGIRTDSADDAHFVEQLAKHYGLPFISTQLCLGADASEESARHARYQWLRRMRDEHRAVAIVTAHHQDDVIETMLINLIRGTGWRGLCSLRDHQHLRRPLLTMSKAEIIQYAIDHGLSWRDDSTNESPRYLRNYVRMTLVPRLSAAQRQRMVTIYTEQSRLSDGIEREVDDVLSLAQGQTGLHRHFLIMSGEQVAQEVITAWARQRFETKSLQRLWHFACTARPGKQLHENNRDYIVTRDELIVSPPHI